MDSTSHVVIVGASLAGLTTAETLRSEGFGGRITLIGDEVHPPYSRPPLSKQILTGEWAHHSSALLTDAELEALDVTLRLGVAATGIDTAGHTIELGGERMPYDTLVIATGTTARSLPGSRGLRGVHSLRTRGDVAGIREGLAAARDVVIVGAGVLGSEIASAARRDGVAVTLIGRSTELRLGRVGTQLSSMIADLHRENGVDLLLGVADVALLGDGQVTAVAPSGGATVVADRSPVGPIPADLVVGAIGCEPATGWLTASGLDLSDGVLCDADGLAAPDVYAVGDVARWRDRVTGIATRVEHQLNATEQAQAVARTLVHGHPAAPVVPFFWSDLYGTKIQAYGSFPTGVAIEPVDGSFAERRFVAASVVDDRIVGVVGWNMPREFRQTRGRMMAAALAAADPTSPTSTSDTMTSDTMTGIAS